MTTGRAGEAVPPEVPLHECAHLRRVRLEVEVQLLRGGDLGLGRVAHAAGEVQVLVATRAPGSTRSCAEPRSIRRPLMRRRKKR